MSKGWISFCFAPIDILSRIVSCPESPFLIHIVEARHWFKFVAHIPVFLCCSGLEANDDTGFVSMYHLCQLYSIHVNLSKPHVFLIACTQVISFPFRPGCLNVCQAAFSGPKVSSRASLTR